MWEVVRKVITSVTLLYVSTVSFRIWMLLFLPDFASLHRFNDFKGSFCDGFIVFFVDSLFVY